MALGLFVMHHSNAQTVLDQQNDPFFGESCTSIMVGRKASSDGSVMTSHTCDGRYRTWLQMDKGATFESDTTQLTCKIYKGLLKSETPWDMRGVKVVGQIPQADKTYSVLNTAYPCLNEKQLAMGETTIVGPKELVNPKGMFQIEELQRIALQRCTTARQAITLIGSLIKEYGYGDWGECITIADKREVWQMEIFGEGPQNIGGVWAAQRIPDDHVGVSANISRIGVLNLNKKNFFMASENVFSAAKVLKRWDGKEEFKFWKVYGGVKKPFKIREFFILSTMAPSLGLSIDADELPFSVKPDHPVSVEDVIALYRETYEGTDYDMTRNMKIIKNKYNDKHEVVGQDTVISPMASPWPMGNSRTLYNSLQKGCVEYQRTVSVSWCSYSHVIQLRDWLPDEIGGVAWFSFDNPGQSPRIPIFCGTTQLPQSFKYSGQKRYRQDAAIWCYRKANKLATIRWQETRGGMMKAVGYFQKKVLDDSPALEKKVKKLLKEGEKELAQGVLNNYSRDFTGATMLRWKEFEQEYWNKFGLGF